MRWRWLDDKASQSRFEPNQITTYRLIPGLIIALAFYQFELSLITALVYLVYLVWAVFTDIYDGAIALTQDKQTCFGDWYDKAADYVAYTSFFWAYGYDIVGPYLYWTLAVIAVSDMIAKTAVYYHDSVKFGVPQEENLSAKMSAKSGPSIALALYTLIGFFSAWPTIFDGKESFFQISFAWLCVWVIVVTGTNIFTNIRKLQRA